MFVKWTFVKRLIVFGGEDYGKLCDTMDNPKKSFGYVKMPTRIHSVLSEQMNCQTGSTIYDSRSETRRLGSHRNCLTSCL